MRTRKLGNTGVDLSVIGFGSAAIVGGRDYGFVERDAKESVRTVHRALEHGINWVDTAPKYADGYVEQLVGRALREWNEPVFVATKCGYSFDPAVGKPVRNLKRASIIGEVENSLKSLGVSCIDLCQIHWPVPDEDIEEAYMALSDMIEQGKVRFAGVSNFSIKQLSRISEIHPLASMQSPYNLFDRDVETGILPYCRDREIAVFAYSPMLSGLLTGAFDRDRIRALPSGDWRHHIDHFCEPLLSISLSAIDDLKRLASELGATLPQLAVAWTLVDSAVTAAIVGARTTSQIDGTVEAGSMLLDTDTIEEINTILGTYGL